MAALKAQSLSEEKDPLLLVLAADHVIQNVQAFHQAIEAALPAASDGKLVTFGIVPTHPETGYGYIKASKTLTGNSGQVSPVDSFVEKPDLETAQSYLASGDYYSHWCRASTGKPRQV
nr:sugar phosphate nucleotidyltransferase [Endozoicomonas sp. 8E]